MFHKCSPFDRAIYKEASSQPLAWYEWEEILDEMMEEAPTSIQVLQQYGVDSVEAVKEQILDGMQTFQKKATAEGLVYNLPFLHWLEDFALRSQWADLAFICQVFQTVDCIGQEKPPKRDNAQLGYWFMQLYHAKEDVDFLRTYRQSRETFLSLTGAMSSKVVFHFAEQDIHDLLLLIQGVYGEQLKISEALQTNLQMLVTAYKADASLHRIAPLFLFAMLTQHKSRLQKNQDITFNLKALWQYKSYHIQKDNGKNFTQYVRYLELFLDLMEYFADDAQVDQTLCRFGFLFICNLSEFYYEQYQVEKDSPIPPDIAHWVEAHYFSCWPNGLEDSHMKQHYGTILHIMELGRFETASHRKRALNRLSEHLGKNIQARVGEYLRTGNVIAMGRELLQECRIVTKSPTERLYYLWSIEVALMEVIDAKAVALWTELFRRLLGED